MEKTLCVTIFFQLGEFLAVHVDIMSWITTRDYTETKIYIDNFDKRNETSKPIYDIHNGGRDSIQIQI